MKVFDCDTCKFRKLFVNIPSRALRKYLNNNKHSTSRKGLPTTLEIKMFAASKQIKAMESKLTGFSHTMYHKVEIIHSIFSAATKQKNTFSFNF